MKYLQNSTNITFSFLGQDAVLKGTVALVLGETFNNPELVYSSKQFKKDCENNKKI